MILFEGRYTLKRMPKDYVSMDDWTTWVCTLEFDGLEVSASSLSRRRALRKATRAMHKAVKLRSAVRSVKGLCDGAQNRTV